MTDSQLTTGWICIATEGITLDGRKIESQWLLDMAETYDVRTYTALIWEEHKRDRDNLGEVLALRSDKQSGIVHLYARIRPTAKLMSYNELGQNCFAPSKWKKIFRTKVIFI
ncbi:phage capsid scaffolding protein [Yersinia enterocolitica subsp. enterocolitica WA-314]|nr:GPO family capsid scaffolding protein [Yersinia enterocolitica]AJI81258.1 phage capsid scaffolding (GPO) serine peptidase family protein [Yersinia enterocolitica]EKA27084.1 phage capsid scaffolding protein [Yersinia enterocolitica subsp. enterocolitica WA-314]CNK08254.1 phage capsid scaffolding [Yersinia enterocolitica]VFS96295.1 putative capsid scaffolding protein from bacteriophage origin [Yersinia enterocolitica]